MNTKISFGKLPPDVRNKLLILQRRGDERIVFPARLPVFYWIGAAAALFWFGYLFAATQNILWEEWMKWVFAGLTFIASLILVFCIYKIFKFYLAKLKNTYVFTPDEFMILDSDYVEAWNLKEIEAVRYLEDTKRLEIWSGERQIFVPARFEKEALQIVDVFDDWKSKAGAGFLQTYRTPEYAFQPAKTALIYAGGFALALALTGVLSYAAQTLNRSSDDQIIWDLTARENTVEAYEKYKAAHPNGAFAAQADAKIGEFVGRLKTDYEKNVKKDFNSDAVQAFSYILGKVAASPERKIYVKITEKRELDEEVVTRLKDLNRISIYPYYTAVPNNLEEDRKNKVFGDLKEVFIKFARNNLVNFEKTDELPANKPSIEIAYTAKSEEMFYTYYLLTPSGGTQLSYYPGVRYFFDFNMKPNSSEPVFNTQFDIVPPRLKDNAYDEKDAVNYSFEKVYFATVSESYGKFLAQQFGL